MIYDRNGDVRWVRTFEVWSERPLRIAAHVSGDSILAGSATEAAPANFGVEGIRGARTVESFIARHDAAGNLMTIRRLPSAEINAVAVQGNEVLVGGMDVIAEFTF